MLKYCLNVEFYKNVIVEIVKKSNFICNKFQTRLDADSGSMCKRQTNKITL